MEELLTDSQCDIFP